MPKGRIARQKDARRARRRWTDQRSNTFGVVDATRKDIRRLTNWWRTADF